MLRFDLYVSVRGNDKTTTNDPLPIPSFLTRFSGIKFPFHYHFKLLYMWIQIEKHLSLLSATEHATNDLQKVNRKQHLQILTAHTRSLTFTDRRFAQGKWNSNGRKTRNDWFENVFRLEKLRYSDFNVIRTCANRVYTTHCMYAAYSKAVVNSRKLEGEKIETDKNGNSTSKAAT